MNIYVGNLSRQSTEAEVRVAFEAFGRVEKVSIIRDKFTGDSRGFGFVEMPTKEEAMAAIAGLDGQELGGRTLSVNEARPRNEGGRRGDDSYGGGRGGARRGDGQRGGRGRSW